MAKLLQMDVVRWFPADFSRDFPKVVCLNAYVQSAVKHWCNWELPLNKYTQIHQTQIRR